MWMYVYTYVCVCIHCGWTHLVHAILRRNATMARYVLEAAASWTPMAVPRTFAGAGEANSCRPSTCRALVSLHGWSMEL
jgi:hypothetical protein